MMKNHLALVFFVTKNQNGEIIEYLKLFKKYTPLGVSYAMRIYGKECESDNPRFHKIQLVFREQEKTDEELISIFRRFSDALRDKIVTNSNPFRFGISNIRAESESNYVFINFFKDIYCDDIDVDVNGVMNIEFGTKDNNSTYQAFDDLFNALGVLQPPVLNLFDREYFVRTRKNNELE